MKNGQSESGTLLINTAITDDVLVRFAIFDQHDVCVTCGIARHGEKER